MKRVEVESYPVSIFMAGSWLDAEPICREHCDAVGLCVTVTDTFYTYTGGQERGIIVGLINYPRFPKEPRAIWWKAEQLAAFLCQRLGQQSYTIQAPDKTVWFSNRPEDAPC